LAATAVLLSFLPELMVERMTMYKRPGCRTAMRYCLAVALFPACLAFGQDDAAGGDGALPGTTAAQAAGKRVEVGMSLEEALEVLGKAPDSTVEIGAACGMLDVLTWEDEGTRLISVDGTISSIVDDKSEP
jgi:hypothetical protein